MSQATSLYRRHRPQSFAEVVGQEHVVRTLGNAIKTERVHHAYLFVGSRGTGKTSMAKILARSLNCVDGPTLEPCGVCDSCITIASGTSMDVIELDAASNRSVDDIRDLRERVNYAPAAGHWRIFILDEAHMLTREAWNAFLKTLEEPPPNTVFVLATTEAHKVMPTIVDRCQRFDFQRPSLANLATVIERVAGSEEIEVEPGAVAAIARAATGSFRDALGTLDQLVAYGGKQVATDDVLAVLGVAEAELILAAAEAIAAGDGRAVFETSEKLTRSGRDPVRFGADLVAHLRQLLVLRTAPDATEIFTLTAAGPDVLRAQAESFTDVGLVRAIDVLTTAMAAVRGGDEARTTIELALLKSARPQVDPSREALLQRLAAVEASLGIDGGSGPGSAPTPPLDTKPTPPPVATTSTPSPAVVPASTPAVAAKPTPAVTPAPVAVEQPAPLEASAATESETARPPASVEPAPAKPAPTPTPPTTPTEPPPATPAAAPSAPLTLEALNGAWPALVERVRVEHSETHAHVLDTAWPLAVHADRFVVELGLPAEMAFYKRRGETSESRDQFAEALENLTGFHMKPVYELVDGGQVPLSDEPELTGEELIEKLKSEFGATELESESDWEQMPEEAN